jgi:hypothetical protein
MTLRPRRLVAAAVAICACAAAGAVLVADAGGAQQVGTTYTVKPLKTLGSVWIAGGGKPMRPGRLSPGNRLLETNRVLRDDGVKGVFLGTVMVASPRTVPAKRAIGLMRGVYRFDDGDVYVDGYVTFSRPSGTGVIVGGSGPFRGARGTFTSTEARDVLTLVP